jgi:hypothetical protein
MLFRKKSKDGPPGKKLWETYFKEMLKKNMQKALAVLNELKELEPDNSQVHMKIGDILQRGNDVAGSVLAYHEAASCLINEAHQEKAIAIYKIILRLDPDNSDAQQKMEEVVAYLESLGTGDSPLVSVGIEEMPEMPVHEAEAEAGETQPEAETEGVSEEAWMTGEAEAEAGEAQPAAETEGVSEEAWMTGEAEAETGEAQPAAETEGVSEEAWMTGEAEAETGEAQPAAEDSPAESTEEPSTILSALGEKETENLFEKAMHRSFTYGENVVEEGETGDSMFVIKKGEARVTSNILGKYVELATLKEGDIFGEMVFLSGRPRTASVVAVGDLEVLEVTSELLQEVVENNPEVQNRIAEFFYSRVQDTLKKVRER